MYAPDHAPAGRTLPEPVEEPAAAWVLAGLGAGLAGGTLAFGLATLLSAAVGLPWHRPINLLASFVYGPQIALVPQLERDWIIAAAAVLLPAAAGWGIAYGLVVVAGGYRPGGRVGLALGLLTGACAWLLTVKGLAPLVGPLTVRMAPAWAVLVLALIYGAALALTLPLSRWIIDAALPSPAPNPPAPPPHLLAPRTPWRRESR